MGGNNIIWVRLDFCRHIIILIHEYVISIQQIYFPVIQTLLICIHRIIVHQFTPDMVKAQILIQPVNLAYGIFKYSDSLTV